MNRRNAASFAATLLATSLLAACNPSAPSLDQFGANPELPEPDRGLLPNMTIFEKAALLHSLLPSRLVDVLANSLLLP